MFEVAVQVCAASVVKNQQLQFHVKVSQGMFWKSVHDQLKNHVSLKAK